MKCELTVSSWKIAIPVVIGTVIVLMRDIIYESFVTFSQRRHIIGIRKRRKSMDRARRRDRLRLPRSS